MNNNNDSGINTLLLVVILVVIVGGLVWFFKGGMPNDKDNGGTTIDVNLPAPQTDGGETSN